MIELQASGGIGTGRNLVLKVWSGSNTKEHRSYLAVLYFCSFKPKKLNSPSLPRPHKILAPYMAVLQYIAQRTSVL